MQTVLMLPLGLGRPARAISETLGWQIAALFALQILFSIAIILHPQIDAQLSGTFYRAGIGFPLSHDIYLQTLRWLGRAVPAAVVVSLVGLVVWRIARCRPFETMTDRALAFVAASFAIGPGLIVNVILKSHWGRSRPLATDLFGGSEHFTVAWWPWGECASNCSFVSGEASTAAVFMAFAVVAHAHHRKKLALAVTVWMIAISWNRMAFGAHYFSDVVLSCLLTITVVLVLKALILRNEPAA